MDNGHMNRRELLQSAGAVLVTPAVAALNAAEQEGPALPDDRAVWIGLMRRLAEYSSQLSAISYQLSAISFQLSATLVGWLLAEASGSSSSSSSSPCPSPRSG